MDRDGDSPSFWFQPPITPTRSYRRPSSPIINPVILIMLLPILALLLLFFLLPPVLSHASFIFRPNSVKKSWDSINVFLVLFAVLCGVLARRNHDTSSTDVNDAVNDVTFDDKLNSSVPDIWFEDSDTKFYTSKVGVPENGVRRLRRNSSYPDLKQESPWETGVNRYRFYDDFEVNLNLNRWSDSEYAHHRVRRSEVSEVDTDESDVKEIPVDTFVNRSSPSPPRKSPSPPLAPPPPMKNLSRRTYRSVPKQDEVENNETEFLQIPTPPPSSPPPPPPPPPVTARPSLQLKREKRDRKTNSAAKDIATTITSLYNQSKRKRKHKTRNINDNSTQSPPSTHSVETVESELPPAPAPPPPPPPPLPLVFHNMFRKGTKSKRIHSLSASVPPAPPPPPPGSIFNHMFKNSSKSKRFSATATNSVSSAPPPPPPPPSSILNTLFKTGSKSKRFQSTSTSPPSSPQSPPVSLTSNQKPKRMSHIHIQPPPEAPPPPQQPEYSRRRTVSSWKPPLPTRANSYYEREEYLNSGAQSPLIPVPPPPPPFKMAETKFVFSGEISSNQSSRSTSPERENVGTSSTNRSPRSSYGGASTGSGFCPSPDVNVKAATFIARLRDEWRLEKMNSVKERQKMGPTPGP